jgi:hypothetical protein
MKGLAKIGAAILGTVLFGYWIRALGFAPIREAVVGIGWAFLAIVALGGLREAVRALAWMRSVDGQVRLPFRDALAARLAGEAIATLVPMGVLVGEPTKADLVSHRLPFGTAFRALIIEFAFYTASLPLFFTVGALAFVPAAAALIVPIIAVGAIAAPRVALPDKVRTLVNPLLEFSRLYKQRIWRIGAFEIAYHVLAIVEVYVILALVAPGHASVISALVLETVNRGVTIVFKMIPMRLGVDEAGAALVAARVDLSPATGVTVALVRKLRLLVWNAIGLLVLFTNSARMRRSVAPVTAARG